MNRTNIVIKTNTKKMIFRLNAFVEVNYVISNSLKQQLEGIS